MVSDEGPELQDREQEAGDPRLSPNKTWAINHNLGVLN